MKKQEKIYSVIGTTIVIAASCLTGFTLFNTPESNSLLSASTKAKIQQTVATQASTTTTTYNRYQQTSTTQASTTTTAASTSNYTDGSYTALAYYSVPRGQNSIQATITISNDKITSVTTQNSSNDHESQRYIDSFESYIQNAAVGQDIDSLYLSRVGGASLTTSGFNSVLEAIQTHAKK